MPSAYNGFELEKAVNGGDASLVGYELAFQRQIFPGLGLYMNVTSISSKIDNLDPELQADRPDIKDDPMPGTSELSYNLSLSMDRGPLNFEFENFFVFAFIIMIASMLLSRKYILK